MKKRYFLLIFILIGILYLFYTKDNHKDDILNKRHLYDNIEINYPYFNNEKIDTYIDNYLQDKISNFNYNNYHSLFLDYDIDKIKSAIELTFYENMNKDNLLKKDIHKLLINTKNNEIKQVKSVANTTNNNYDHYTQKSIDKHKPIIAFTFDDGPNYNTSKILSVLNKYQVTATFFVLGLKIKGNEDIIKKMDAYNMEIGNHTYSHKLLTNMSKNKIKDDLEKTNQLIFDITNKYPTLTRPSYGSVNKKAKSVIETPIIIWNVDPLDWKCHNSKKIANRILNKVSDGDIILLHDIYSATVNAVDIVIPKLLAKGYQIVSVSELFYYKEIPLENKKVYGSS